MPHRFYSLVARRWSAIRSVVAGRQPPAPHFIRTNMLCNPAYFISRYICLTNTVKERCLSMVNMPEKSYYWGAIHQIFNACRYLLSNKIAFCRDLLFF